MKTRIVITDRQMQVWKLRYVTGWSQRRIARHLGISESAVSQRLARLRKRFGSKWLPGTRPKRSRIRAASLAQIFARSGEI